MFRRRNAFWCKLRIHWWINLIELSMNAVQRESLHQARAHCVLCLWLRDPIENIKRAIEACSLENTWISIVLWIIPLKSSSHVNTVKLKSEQRKSNESFFPLSQCNSFLVHCKFTKETNIYCDKCSWVFCLCKNKSFWMQASTVRLPFACGQIYSVRRGEGARMIKVTVVKWNLEMTEHWTQQTYTELHNT